MNITSYNSVDNKELREHYALWDLACSGIGVAGFLVYRSSSSLTVSRQFLLAILIYMFSFVIREVLKGLVFKILGSKGSKIQFNVAKSRLTCVSSGLKLSPAKYKVALVLPFVILTGLYIGMGYTQSLPSVMFFDIFWTAGASIADFATIQQINAIERQEDILYVEDTLSGVDIYSE